MTAWLSVLVTLFVPGLPFAIALWRRVPSLRSPALLVPTVPLCSIAVVFTVVMFSPFGSITRTLSLAVMIVFAVAAGIVTWRLPMREPDERPTIDRWALIGVGAIALAATVGVTAWVSGMPGLDQPPPNFDAAAHSFMTARIIETGSNSPSDAVISGPEGVAGAAGYYPLGIHSSAAVATAMSGQSVATILNVFVIFFAGVIYPVACYALVRQVLPSLRFAAPLAALASTAVEAFPYKPIGWGGIGLIIGNVTAFALAALLIRLVRSRELDWTAIVFAGLATVGLFHIHNSEVVVAGVLVALMFLIDLPATADGAAMRIDRRKFRDAWSALWRVGVVCFVALLPVVTSVVRGGEERSSFDDTPLGEPLHSLGQILFMQTGLRRQGAMLLLAIAGMSVLVRRRKYALPAAFVLVVVGAYWTATTDNPVSEVLTFPWWRQAERMMYVISMLASLAFGFAVAAVLDPIERTRRLPAAVRWTSIAVIVGAVGGLVLVPGAAAGRTMVYRSYLYYSPITDSAREGFEVAANLAGDDGSVLTDFNRDASLWMYAYTGAQPLYALELADHSGDPTWSDRFTLVTKMALIGSDPEQDALVEKYDVRAVYFDDNTYSGSEHTTTRDALRAAPGLREVFTDGSVSVFAVVREERAVNDG